MVSPKFILAYYVESFLHLPYFVLRSPILNMRSGEK